MKIKACAIIILCILPAAFSTLQKTCVWHDSDAAGWLDPSTHIIFLNASKIATFEKAGELAIHEKVHDVVLSLHPSIMKQWAAIHFSSTVFVTDYAQNCRTWGWACNRAEEDLAETIAYGFSIKWDPYKIDNERVTFLEQRINISKYI